MAVKEFEHAQTTFKRGDDIRLDPGASTHLCLTSQRRAAILGLGGLPRHPFPGMRVAPAIQPVAGSGRSTALSTP